MPCCWLYPLATKRALYLAIDPSGFRLHLKTQRQPIGKRPLGTRSRDIISQVPFLAKEFNSLFICRASQSDVGGFDGLAVGIGIVGNNVGGIGKIKICER